MRFDLWWGRGVGVALLLQCVLLAGCEQEAKVVASPNVAASCRKTEASSCDHSCRGRQIRFSECFIDPRYVKGSVSWRECFAIRVGNKCPPCNQIFSINGAGSFRSVSCEYFYEAIELRNKQCKNCLKLAPNVDFSEDDIK